MYFPEYVPSPEADEMYARAKAMWEAARCPPPPVNWQDPWVKPPTPRGDPSAKISGVAQEKYLKKEWLLADSGATHELQAIRIGDKPPPVAKKVKLNTANGTTKAEEVVDSFVAELGADVQP